MAGLTSPRRASSSAVLPLPAAAALVAAGGSVGVLARALIEQGLPAAPGAWPWATFGINVTGSLVLGALLAVLQRGPDVGRRRAVRWGVGTGVIGGYTTYSTFVLEVQELLAAGYAATGIAYALVSVVAGVLAAVVGMVVAARVVTRRAPAEVGGVGPGGVGGGARPGGVGGGAGSSGPSDVAGCAS